MNLFDASLYSGILLYAYISYKLSAKKVVYEIYEVEESDEEVDEEEVEESDEEGNEEVEEEVLDEEVDEEVLEDEVVDEVDNIDYKFHISDFNRFCSYVYENVKENSRYKKKSKLLKKIGNMWKGMTTLEKRLYSKIDF